MPKVVVLYNLKDSASKEEYENWCKSFKGPFFISLGPCKAYTILKFSEGQMGDGSQHKLPQIMDRLPFQYMGIIEIEDVNKWNEITESTDFKEKFFIEWFQKWVGEFWLILADEIFEAHK